MLVLAPPPERHFHRYTILEDLGHELCLPLACCDLALAAHNLLLAHAALPEFAHVVLVLLGLGLLNVVSAGYTQR
jgi:hypothetical protein